MRSQDNSSHLIQWLKRIRKKRMPELGAREIGILECLWEHPDASAQQVTDWLSGSGRAVVSLSTVQSTLERLTRKQLVSRNKHGRAYLYRPVLERQQLIGGLLRDLADDLAGGHMAPMISGFLDYVAEEDPALESQLASLLEVQNKKT
jgi:predicted transcriptional regulator